MPTSEQPQSNRRRSRRLPPKEGGKVSCRKGTLGLGADLAIRLLDLAEGGVRLVIKEELKKGQEVEVEIDPPGGRKAVKRLGVVAWSVPTAENEHCVGIEFEKSLDYRFFSDLIKLE